jgi:alanine racemase
VEEGVSLRDRGVRKPILVLGSLFPFKSFEAALAHTLTPIVASVHSAQALGDLARAKNQSVPVHIKVDTGMGRIGVSPRNLPALVQAVQGHKSLVMEGIYTHLASADGDPEMTRRQIESFAQAVEEARRSGGKFMAHAANSAATLAFPEGRFDMVRPGLALYGVSPFSDGRFARELSPVLSWKTRVVYLKNAPSDTPVSYGGTFRTQRASKIATLPVGYADGYTRALSNRGKVLIGGRACPVLGRVTMDQIMVDVTDVPDVQVGNEAVLLGRQGESALTAAALAEWAQTISYEILCGISARVPRVVVSEPS